MLLQKKILHFHPNGKFAKHFVRPLIDAELDAGYSSVIVTSVNSDAVGAIKIHYDLSFKNLFFLPFAFFQVYRLLRKEVPDVVISHNSKSSFLILASARLAKIPVRIYFNHGVPYVGYRGFLRLTLLALEKANLLLSTKVFTVSVDMLNLLKSLNGSKSISLINNGSACGLDLSSYGHGRYSRPNFRRDYDIAEDDFVLLFIGRPERRKGFNLTLELWTRYFSAEKCKLVLCGPSKLDVIKVLGFSPDNVVPLGYTDKVPEILSQSDLLILPSLHEGLSYAILEAMASGCLTISNDIDGIRSIIKNGSNGFLVKDNNINEYAEIISNIQVKPKSAFDDVRKHALETAKLYSREAFLATYLLHLH
ncbi:glycosyltransferase family 4 protein [Polynucleobacter paneuropaeus]|nr:glycosyltransferase family 4 protein [Polynucleobacter paneuropaeus]